MSRDTYYRLKNALPRWAAPVVALLAAWFIHTQFAPAKPVYGTLYQPAASVYVSAYTRSDGTWVSSHYRTAPGARAYANTINSPIRMQNRQLQKDYEMRRWLAWFATGIVGFCSWLFLYREPAPQPSISTSCPTAVPIPVSPQAKANSTISSGVIPKPRREGFFLGSSSSEQNPPRITHQNTRSYRPHSRYRSKKR